MNAWWRSAVIYQVYPRSFRDADGDGIGDLRGVLDGLDHLQELGVGAVWLGPVCPSPQADNGYDVADYLDVDPLFGTMEDLDALIAGVHERGMRIIMDMVFNHSSDQHPWFRASRSSRDAAKRDWYIWRPPRPGPEPGTPGAEPTNWGAVFSGSAWTYDEPTGEYYLGVFSPEQPDLNWENPRVRSALYDVLRFWLARGVDGFRMDVINHISKDPAYPDGQVLPGHRYGSAGPHIVDGPRVHEFLAELRREVLGDRRDIVLIGEMPGTTVERARRYTDQARGEVDMVVQFEHLDLDRGPSGKWDPRPLQLLDLKRSFARWQEGLAEVGWNSLYLSNHDQPRQVSRFGADSRDREAAAKAIATILHLQRGTPFVYQGEELGLANAPIDGADDLHDIESRNHYIEAVASGADPEQVLATMRPLARDTSRTPMPWDETPHGGFTTGEPWAAVAPDHLEANAQAQRADPDSVFHHYRRLIELRRREAVVVEGDLRMLMEDDPQVYAFIRSLGATELLVIANLGPAPADVGSVLVEWGNAQVIVESPATASVAEGSATLAPWAAQVRLRQE